MPKMKTKSGAKKRFRVRGSGSIKRSQAFKRHILTKKSTKTKRQLRGSAEIHSTNLDSVKDLMPYAEGATHAKSQTWCNRSRASQEGPGPGQGLPRPPE